MDRPRLNILKFQHSLLVGALSGLLFKDREVATNSAIGEVVKQEREIYSEICRIENNLIEKEND